LAKKNRGAVDPYGLWPHRMYRGSMKNNLLPLKQALLCKEKETTKKQKKKRRKKKKEKEKKILSPGKGETEYI